MSATATDDVDYIDDENARDREITEAKEIIHKVEKLNSFDGIQRFRWVWELVQNAKDTSKDTAIEPSDRRAIRIDLELTPDAIFFKHNGPPFKYKDLSALIRKASSKDLNGSDGQTGKYGTGFITTHLLNKEVTVSGTVIGKDGGKRKFSLKLNRRPEGETKMLESIEGSISQMKQALALPPIDEPYPNSSFHYSLTETKHEIAIGGLNQLRSNLAFTLLVNRYIQSVRIIEPDGRDITVERHQREDLLEGIFFFQTSVDGVGNGQEGLLCKESENLTIAHPARKGGETWELLPLREDQARLYREFPLIGTEDFFIPAIVQHENFRPREERDGIRTKKSDEAETDELADSNRASLLDFVYAFPEFVESLIANGVSNLHYLANTGLPGNVNELYGESWLKENVLSSLRSCALSHPIVRTVSGKFIPISEARFLDSHLVKFERWHDFVAALWPDSCPDKASAAIWSRMIARNSESWPDGISVGIRDVVKEVHNREVLTQLPGVGENNADHWAWLQCFVLFLEEEQQINLGSEFYIYPDRNNKLHKADDIKKDPGIPSPFFQILRDLGRDLDNRLLPEGFSAREIGEFDFEEEVSIMNNQLAELSRDVSIIKEPEVDAVLAINCLFGPGTAPKREEWYQLLQDLLPKRMGEPTKLDEFPDNYTDSGRKTSHNYICHLIQKSDTVAEFAATYFEEVKEDALKWLNRFLQYILGSETNRKDAAEYQIVPLLNGNFAIHSATIFQRKEGEPFDEKIMALYDEFVAGPKGKPKSRAIIICDEIDNPHFPAADLDLLAQELNGRFGEPEIYRKVQEGNELHSLFMNLRKWLQDHPEQVWHFPLFKKEEPVLYIKAVGESPKFSRLIDLASNPDVDIDKIEEIAKSTLSLSDLRKLTEAAEKAGGADKLLQVAEEIRANAEQRNHNKRMGDAAESAFTDALATLAPNVDWDNPDNGMDFILKLQASSREYMIELKSTVEGSPSVNMTIKQGETAVANSEYYALCVVERPAGLEVNEEMLRNNARFVLDIGTRIGDRIAGWRNRTEVLPGDGEVRITASLNDPRVSVARSVWEQKIGFDEFMEYLQAYFIDQQAQVEI